MQCKLFQLRVINIKVVYYFKGKVAVLLSNKVSSKEVIVSWVFTLYNEIVSASSVSEKFGITKILLLSFHRPA